MHDFLLGLSKLNIGMLAVRTCIPLLQQLTSADGVQIELQFSIKVNIFSCNAPFHLFQALTYHLEPVPQNIHR